MTLVGHTLLSFLVFIVFPNPITFLFIFFSHFLFDKYPDYYRDKMVFDERESTLYDALFVLLEAMLFLTMFYVLSIRFNVISITNGIIVTLLAMFPDITEGIYLGAKYLFDKKHTWEDKFWFNHDGFFPFRANNWQYATKTFRCFSRTQTLVIDMVAMAVVFCLTYLFWR